MFVDENFFNKGLRVNETASSLQEKPLEYLVDPGQRLNSEKARILSRCGYWSVHPRRRRPRFLATRASAHSRIPCAAAILRTQPVEELAALQFGA